MRRPRHRRLATDLPAASPFTYVFSMLVSIGITTAEFTLLVTALRTLQTMDTGTFGHGLLMAGIVFLCAAFGVSVMIGDFPLQDLYRRRFRHSALYLGGIGPTLIYLSLLLPILMAQYLRLT